MRGLIVAAEPCGYGELEEIPVREFDTFQGLN